MEEPNNYFTVEKMDNYSIQSVNYALNRIADYIPLNY